ncbi:hypothetical protein [Helicobacter canis]|uniref:Uncharacterized protein n=1 Tax=Helicobacter canis NCTC 12740 TaxID=1357399 RepID=V8CES9_9HELI|nr:hypothetical protein [Helicobacter canis]ETD25592.1 hypothetical protein HMPREF2087_01420 [Helicobacter canis NCTC 12740]
MGDKHQDSFAALLQQANIKQQLQETFIKQLAELNDSYIHTGIQLEYRISSIPTSDDTPSYATIEEHYLLIKDGSKQTEILLELPNEYDTNRTPEQYREQLKQAYKNELGRSASILQERSRRDEERGRRDEEISRYDGDIRRLYDSQISPQEANAAERKVYAELESRAKVIKEHRKAQALHISDNSLLKELLTLSKPKPQSNTKENQKTKPNKSNDNISKKR